MQTHKDFGLIFWLHLALIIAVCISPFVLDWKIIIFFTGLYYLQLMIFGSCILSMIEFKSGEKRKSFFHHYLARFGFEFDQRKLLLILDYVVPTVVIVTALVLQLKLHYNPLLALR